MSTPVNPQIKSNVQPIEAPSQEVLSDMKVKDLQKLVLTTVTTANSSISSLGEKTAKLTAELDRAQTEINSLKAENETLKKELGSTKNNVSNAKSSLSRAGLTIGDLDQENTNLKKTIDANKVTTTPEIAGNEVATTPEQVEMSKTLYDKASAALTPFSKEPVTPYDKANFETFKKEANITLQQKNNDSKAIGAMAIAGAIAIAKEVNSDAAATTPKEANSMGKPRLLAASAAGLAAATLSESGIASYIYKTVASKLENMPSFDASKAFLNAMPKAVKDHPTFSANFVGGLGIGIALAGAALYFSSSKKSEGPSPAAVPNSTDQTKKDSSVINESSAPKTHNPIKQTENLIEQHKNKIAEYRKGIESSVNNRGIISDKNPTEQVTQASESITKEFEKIEALEKEIKAGKNSKTISNEEFPSEMFLTEEDKTNIPNIIAKKEELIQNYKDAIAKLRKGIESEVNDKGIISDNTDIPSFEIKNKSELIQRKFKEMDNLVNEVKDLNKQLEWK